MTKEYVFEVSKGTDKEMSTLDKIIILWFIAKAINIIVLLIKRIFKK